MQRGQLIVNLSKEEQDSYYALGYWKDETIVDYFKKSVKKNPNKEFLVDTRGKRFTYAQVDERVKRLALKFHDMGLDRGEMIAHQMTNCAEAYIMMLAAYSVEAILSPIVPVYKGKGVVEMLNVTKPRAIIVHDAFGGYEYAKKIGESKKEIPSIEHIFVEGKNVPEGMISLNEIIENPVDTKRADSILSDYHPRGWNIEKVAFTAGTTGTPKGSIQRFDNQMYNIRKYIEGLKITEDDITLGMTPITHQWCWLYAFGMPIMTNSKVVLMDSWNAENCSRLIDKEKVTYFCGMTTFLLDFTDHWIKNKDKYNFSSLRVGHVAGQKLVPRRMIKAAREIGFKNLYGVWGQTENCAPVTHAVDPKATDSDDLLCDKTGLMWPEMQYDLKDPETGKSVPQGSIGEMCMKGPSICQGYYGNVEATAKTWDKDGWFHATDLFSVDPDGWLIFQGRLIEMLRRGAENVYLAGIERSLDVFVGNHPKIKEATIVAVQDERLGERGCLCLVVREKQFLNELNHVQLLEGFNTHLLQQGFNKFQLPEYVHLYEDYPRSAMQRIKKLDMSKELSELKRKKQLKGVAEDALR